MRREKLNATVDIQVIHDFSQLSPYSKNENTVYELYGISHHSGSLYGGHYTSEVMYKDRHGKKQWYECNDSNVKPISGPDLKSHTAYVLFYELIDSKSRC
jgi:ubiquitin C-terminal hydrolase